ncbi:MAG TPA: condensation domain-containing protein, partial [Chthoniobacterales bacterium]|nr:condensation domain-containing protein [Chthoniobacterales bacterium]
MTSLKSTTAVGTADARDSERKTIQRVYPLTPLQQGLLFHHLTTTGGDPYLASRSYRFATRFHLDRYLRAFQDVMRRHDILRSSLRWEGCEEPVQVVWRVVSLPVEEIALQGDEGIMQLTSRLRQLRIDLRMPPLVRAFISKDNDESWILQMVFHHLVYDQAAWQIIRDEIEAFLLGTGHLLPVPLQFGDFVEHVRSQSADHEHEIFFRALLGDVDQTSTPFQAGQGYCDDTEIVEARRPVTGDLATRLRTCARGLDISPAIIFHQAWAQVLARICAQDDVVFGTVLYTGSRHSEGGHSRVLGPLINTLPLRIKIDDIGAETAVLRTRNLIQDLRRHQHASLASAQRCSRIAPPEPLFAALFNYRHSRGPATGGASTKGCAWDGILAESVHERTNYPLTFIVDDFGENFELISQVRGALEPERLCTFMQRGLEQLIDALEFTPQRPIRELDVLPGAERAQVIEKRNATEVEYPQELCIHDLFEAQAERTPEAVAVVYEGEELSYWELNARANRIAQELRNLGVGPNERVGICVERGLEMVVGILGVLKAGGAYVPLEPGYPIERLSYMLEDS